jgi:hypothetical protein
MTTTVTTTNKNFSEIVQWLQENVGPVLHSQPEEPGYEEINWILDIPEEHLTYFALKWS